MVSPSAFAVPRFESQFEFRWACDREVCDVRAFEDAPDQDAHLIVRVHQVRPVAHQTSGQREFANMIDRRNRALRCQLNKAHAPGVEKGIVFDDQPTNFLLSERGETVVDFRVVAGSNTTNSRPIAATASSKSFERRLL